MDEIVPQDEAAKLAQRFFIAASASKQKFLTDVEAMAGVPDDPNTILVANPVTWIETVVLAGSVQYEASCGHTVWISPFSQVTLQAIPRAKVVCVVCATTKLQEGAP